MWKSGATSTSHGEGVAREETSMSQGGCEDLVLGERKGNIGEKKHVCPKKKKTKVFKIFEVCLSK